ncbi:MAG: DUF1365 domain-containing protein [Hydrogenophilaceae bacterium]|nr:DUF1365 domain-containing protein [Hydrogenophilaceae bacterium]
MQSCLYAGQVRHRRHAPRPHAFSYRLFMLCLDLDELDSVFAGRWLWSTRSFNLAWFRRADHLGPRAQSLKQSVLDLVETRLGFRPSGRVLLVTHLRYFGHGFNPVSFYYCQAAGCDQLQAIVAEINNTPWGEQFCYAMDARGSAGQRLHAFQLTKQFHVSPFMPMEQRYEWRFSAPSDTLVVHMINREHGKAVFDATLSLQRQPITSTSLARALIGYPLMTVKVISAIYWQAFRLWLKSTPFHSHPAKTRKEILS